jgi:hypothetical protein
MLQRNIILSAALLLAMGAVDGLAKPSNPTNSTTTTTGHGIMMTIETSGKFAVSADATYVFDATEAGDAEGAAAPVTYYNNTRTNMSSGGGYTALSVSGFTVGYKAVGGTGSGSLTDAELIAAMGDKLPSADPDKLIALIESGNQNTGDWADFARGGSSSLLASTTYDIVVRHVTDSSSVKDYDFKYTFAITPKADLTFVALTGWTLDELDESGTARVKIDGTIAAQSLVKKVSSRKGSTTTTKKYDFGLANADDTSRITYVEMKVDKIVDEDSADAASSFLAYPEHQIVSAGFDDENVFNGSFYFEENAGSFGTAAEDLMEGDARAILNNDPLEDGTTTSGDTFAGNDDGGVDGRALQHAVLDRSQFLLGEGAWRVTVRGNVKGNDGVADFDNAFSVDQTIDVILIRP